MLLEQLIEVTDRYRQYIRKIIANDLLSRRYGNNNPSIGTTEYFNSKLLEKVLNGNLSLKLKQTIILPLWMTQEQFNRLLSTVKTTISNDQ